MPDSRPAEQTFVAWWLPLWEFLVHVIVGTGIFLLIATPAVALNLFVSWLDTKGVGIWIIYGLQVAEYSIFVIDIALFLIFLARTAWRVFPKL